MLEKNEKFDIVYSIIHSITKASPIYSAQATPLTKGDGNYEFLEGCIRSALLNSTRRSAKFYKTENFVLEQSQIIMNNFDEKTFVESSEKIARYLYNPMIQATSKPCDLVIAKCRKEDNTYFIAILMLEVVNRIYHQEKYDASGKIYLEFRSDIKTLPSDNKLLKVALIRPYHEHNIYDLIVDKYSSKVQYFMHGFLYSNLIYDDNVLVEKFYSILSDSENATGDYTILDRFLDHVEEHDDFDIERFIEETDDEVSKNSIDNHLHASGIIETEILVDHDFIEKNYRREKIALTNGIVIKAPLREHKNIRYNPDDNSITISDVAVIKKTIQSR